MAAWHWGSSVSNGASRGLGVPAPLGWTVCPSAQFMYFMEKNALNSNNKIEVKEKSSDTTESVKAAFVTGKESTEANEFDMQKEMGMLSPVEKSAENGSIEKEAPVSAKIIEEEQKAEKNSQPEFLPEKTAGEDSIVQNLVDNKQSRRIEPSEIKLFNGLKVMTVKWKKARCREVKLKKTIKRLKVEKNIILTLAQKLIESSGNPAPLLLLNGYPTIPQLLHKNSTRPQQFNQIPTSPNLSQPPNQYSTMPKPFNGNHFLPLPLNENPFLPQPLDQNSTPSQPFNQNIILTPSQNQNFTFFQPINGNQSTKNSALPQPVKETFLPPNENLPFLRPSNENPAENPLNQNSALPQPFNENLILTPSPNQNFTLPRPINNKPSQQPNENPAPSQPINETFQPPNKNCPLLGNENPGRNHPPNKNPALQQPSNESLAQLQLSKKNPFLAQTLDKTSDPPGSSSFNNAVQCLMSSSSANQKLTSRQSASPKSSTASETETASNDSSKSSASSSSMLRNSPPLCGDPSSKKRKKKCMLSEKSKMVCVSSSEQSTAAVSQEKSKPIAATFVSTTLPPNQMVEYISQEEPVSNTSSRSQQEPKTFSRACENVEYCEAIATMQEPEMPEGLNHQFGFQGFRSMGAISSVSNPTNLTAMSQAQNLIPMGRQQICGTEVTQTLETELQPINSILRPPIYSLGSNALPAGQQQLHSNTPANQFVRPELTEALLMRPGPNASMLAPPNHPLASSPELGDQQQLHPSVTAIHCVGPSNPEHVEAQIGQNISVLRPPKCRFGFWGPVPVEIYQQRSQFLISNAVNSPSENKKFKPVEAPKPEANSLIAIQEKGVEKRLKKANKVVVIRKNGSPDFSREELRSLAADISRTMSNIPGIPFKFGHCYYRQGTLFVKLLCAYEKLIKVIQILSPWRGSLIHFRKCNNVFDSLQIALKIPRRYAGDSQYRIFEALHKENPDFDIWNWKLILRKSTSNDHILTIAVPEYERVKFKNVSFNMCFGTEKVKASIVINNT